MHSMSSINISLEIMSIFLFSSDSCNCYSPVICTCDMVSPRMDMEAFTTSLNNIMAKEDKILKQGESVQEALEIRVRKYKRLFCKCWWLFFCPAGQVWLIRHCHREQLYKNPLLCRQDQHSGGGGGCGHCIVVVAVVNSQCCCQIEVPQCDVKPLGKESFLCKRITRPSTK